MNKHFNIPLKLSKGQLYRYITSKSTKDIQKSDLFYLKKFKPYLDDGIECSTAYYKQYSDGTVELTAHQDVITTYNGEFKNDVKDYYELTGFYGYDKDKNEMWCNSNDSIVIFGPNENYNEMVYKQIYKDMFDEKLQERSMDPFYLPYVSFYG